MNTKFQQVLELYSKTRDLYGNPEFVGFGNPNSDVLIIGQEATSTGKDFELFFKNNAEQWKRTLEGNLYAHELKEIPGSTLDDYSFPTFFNPKNPFYPWPFDYKKSHTWYNYQKLMDIVCHHSGNICNFLEHCFMTEMSNLNSEHNPKTKDVEYSIAQRFDLMKETVEFWSHFKVVILACGHYADAIFDYIKYPTLKKDLFGEAHVERTCQFSQVSENEIERLQHVIREQLNLV